MTKIDTYYCTFCDIELSHTELLKHFRCPHCKKFVACGTQLDWMLKEKIKLQLLRQVVSLKDPELLKSVLLLFKTKNDEVLKLALMVEINKKLKEGNANQNEFEEFKDLAIIS